VCMWCRVVSRVVWFSVLSAVWCECALGFILRLRGIVYCRRSSVNVP
jgi:hypothetical protein